MFEIGEERMKDREKLQKERKIMRDYLKKDEKLNSVTQIILLIANLSVGIFALYSVFKPVLSPSSFMVVAFCIVLFDYCIYCLRDYSARMLNKITVNLIVLELREKEKDTKWEVFLLNFISEDKDSLKRFHAVLKEVMEEEGTKEDDK